MHRDSLLKDLQVYARSYPDERESIMRFSAFVREYPDCFKRELAVGHVTGSAFVVSQDGTRILLTHHKKLNRWLQPGGHVDGRSDVLKEALREAEEETGLLGLFPVSRGVFDIDIHPIPETPKEAAHFHYDVRYAFCTTGYEEFAVSEESNDLAWVPLEKIGDYTVEESVLRLVRKWKSFKSNKG